MMLSPWCQGQSFSIAIPNHKFTIPYDVMISLQTASVKSICVTSSQTAYVRKPEFVLCETGERLRGRLICEIYLNTYFQIAKFGWAYIKLYVR